MINCGYSESFSYESFLSYKYNEFLREINDLVNEQNLNYFNELC